MRQERKGEREREKHVREGGERERDGERERRKKERQNKKT